MADMESVKNKLAALFDEFNQQSHLAIKGNKSAGTRSRKMSLEMETLLKEWRKVSVNP